MFKKICIKVVRFIAPEYISGFETRVKNVEMQFVDFNAKVNQRVAEYIGQMDPFEPLMREFHGVFSEEYEHPEENLDPRSQLGMMMWGYQQSTDPHFKHMVNWIMNTQGNASLKRGNPTPETILYGRAQISNMVLLKKEIGRLSLLYEEFLRKQRGEDEVDLGITNE